MSEEETRAQEILAPFKKRINETPALLSLLYDADMLQEQIVTVRGAISVAAVVAAYDLGAADHIEALQAQLSQASAALDAADALADALCAEEKTAGMSVWVKLDACEVTDNALTAYRKARGQDATGEA